jgi:hypothetical protein
MEGSEVATRADVRRCADVLTGQMVGIEVSLSFVGVLRLRLLLRMTILISVFVHGASDQ